MTGKSKIFIGCGVAILIPVFALIGLIVYIGFDKEYMEQHNIVLEEGKNFGKTTDQNGCLQQGLLRMGLVSQPTITQLALNGRFVNECLRTSKPSANFCKDVPKIIVRDWINHQCQLIGRKDDSVCYVVFDEKTTYCTFIGG
jgi:hypothetical protein